MRMQIALALSEFLRHLIQNLGRPLGVSTVSAYARLAAVITEAIDEEEDIDPFV